MTRHLVFALTLGALAACGGDGTTWTLRTTVVDDRCSDVAAEPTVVVRDVDGDPVVEGHEDVPCDPVSHDQVFDRWRLSCANGAGDRVDAIVSATAPHGGTLEIAYGPPENCSIDYDVVASVD